MFDSLVVQPPDTLLGLIKAYQDDKRAKKLDLGVGVYRDDTGVTPVMQAVKSAERVLHEHQDTKAYLGPEGDMQFVSALQPFVFGPSATGVITGLQTPGGSGALRLGAELLALAKPGVRVWVGTPTWPNHIPIFKAAGAAVCLYRYFDTATQTVLFDETMDALSRAVHGDVILLHACCHNPTGADLDADQWLKVARLIAERGLFPLIDFAYQGLGSSLDEDASGMRVVLGAVDEALIAYSRDKNFGLYRDRVGALFAFTRDGTRAAAIDGNMAKLARTNWSMPPDHGAALVRTILETSDLRHAWHNELVRMCTRITDVRRSVVALEPQLQFLGNQRGLFSNFALTPRQISDLRLKHGIYMAPSGRANLAGMRAADAGTLIAALTDVAALREQGANLVNLDPS